METSIINAAVAQKAAEIETAVGVAVLKQAQEAGEMQAMELLQAMPQAPSIGGMGQTVDVSV